MLPPRSGDAPSGIRNDAQHLMYVEGEFDRVVIAEMLDANEVLPPANVRRLGPSQHLRAAAEALHPHQPMSYFLIDRDHFDDSKVAATWQNFPDPATHNLLMLRKKELENYFLDPKFLCRLPLVAEGGFRKPTATEAALRKAIVKVACERVWFDIANATIVSLREELRGNWIQKFEKLRKFPTQSSALDELRKLSNFQSHRERVSEALDPAAIEARFDDNVKRFIGTAIQPMWDKGRWLDFMSGKEIWSAIAGKFFAVQLNTGQFQQGEERERSVARRLVSRPLDELPDDFQEFVALVKRRIESR